MTEQTQPGTSVARQQTQVALGSPIGDLDQAYRLSQALALASVVPDELKGKPGNVLAIILFGQDLGLSPMQSIQGIYIVKGKPHIAGQTWIALARKRGHNPFVACKHCTAPPAGHDETTPNSHRYEADHDASRCTFTVVRGDTRARHTETFTIDDAKTARLLSNDNWSKYPKRMLLWRAATDTMRVICPEIALGFYTEGDDLSDAPTVTVQQVEDEGVTEGEVVEPEKADAEVADLATQFDFSQTPAEPEPVTEALPLPPAGYECSTCEATGEHYEDECPKAVTPR